MGQCMVRERGVLHKTGSNVGATGATWCWGTRVAGPLLLVSVTYHISSWADGDMKQMCGGDRGKCFYPLSLPH